MKVLWICHFSNSRVRENLHLTINSFEFVIRKILKRPTRQWADYAIWISNGIEELEKHKDIELHVISPHYDMRFAFQEFCLNGVHYHFFRPDDNFFLKRGIRFFFKKAFINYKGNRNIINKIVNKIEPDIIHMYGAENIYYSLSALDINLIKYPFLLSLQTLINNIEFKEKYPINKFQYKIISEREYSILNKVKFIGSSVPEYRKLIWKNINPHAIFTKTYLAVAQNIEIKSITKVFDFVYYAASINKAADVAIEAFAIACRKYPKLTLNIIGKTTHSYYEQLKARISELGITNNIIFTDRLPSHDDLLTQIQKSKYALLPLKTDFLSGTIREAMFAGIPVVSTITDGTISLNEAKESILLSEKGDYQAMALNMLKLLESDMLSKKLSKNALITANERWNNSNMINELILVYKSIIDYHKYSKPISSSFVTFNTYKNYVK